MIMILGFVIQNNDYEIEYSDVFNLNLIDIMWPSGKEVNMQVMGKTVNYEMKLLNVLRRHNFDIVVIYFKKP